jgi:lipooligosaccharide transport system permease protein
VVERNARAYLRMWAPFVTGFFEPVFYLFSIGIGVGELVGELPGPGGRPISYELFVAPAMLATSAMNGAVMDTTFGFFFKFKYAKTFDGMLASPLGVADVVRGEMAWALLRGLLYSGAFLVTMAALGLTPTASSGSGSRVRAWVARPSCARTSTSATSSSPSCRCSCSRPPSSR